jgi:hypothetical protein
VGRTIHSSGIVLRTSDDEDATGPSAEVITAEGTVATGILANLFMDMYLICGV